MISYIITPNGVSLTFEGRTVTLSEADHAYPAVVAAIQADDEAALTTALRTKAEVIKEAVVAAGESRVRVEGGAVWYGDEQVHGTLAVRMLDMLREGYTITPMIRFLENLMQNPSNRAVTSLYDFLEVGRMPLTPDGHFLAYKAINADWKDIYTGTISNAIGSVVEVPRNKVDEDPNQTCSHGLHVCSFAYLPHFAHAGGHVVVVKVNPANVVAIPSDYNNTKMRVCRYEVIEEVVGWYQDRADTLRDRGVVGDIDDEALDEEGGSDFHDPEYHYDVECLSAGEWELDERYDNEAEAIAEADGLAKTYRNVRVRRTDLSDPYDDGVTVYGIGSC